MSLNREFAARNINRRSVISLITAAASAAFPAHADETKAKIGLVSWFPPSMKADLGHFRDGMRLFGYIEGKNYEIEAYFTAGNRELTREVVGKMVREPVNTL